MFDLQNITSILFQPMFQSSGSHTSLIQIHWNRIYILKHVVMLPNDAKRLMNRLALLFRRKKDIPAGVIFLSIFQYSLFQ